MIDFPILSLAVLLPLFSALYIMIFVEHSIKVDRSLYIKYVSTLSAAMSLIISIAIMVKLDTENAGFQFVEHTKWISSIGLDYHLGVDGIAALFIFLTSLLTLICIISSFTYVVKNVKEYLVCFLILQSITIGFFSSLQKEMLKIRFDLWHKEDLINFLL